MLFSDVLLFSTGVVYFTDWLPKRLSLLPSYHDIQCFLLCQAGPPDTNRIPAEDALGVTVVLLTCSYRNQEFIRVGYFVNNEYEDPELKENMPPVPQYDKVTDQCSAVVNVVWDYSFLIHAFHRDLILCNKLCSAIRWSVHLAWQRLLC